MIKFYHTLLIAAAMIMSAATVGTAAAQDGDTQYGVLQARIDSLEKRIAASDSKMSRWDKVLANLPKISGYGQMGYEWSGQGDASSSTFSIPSVRITLSGDIGKKVDYKFQFEFASPKLIDAYVRYKICPGFNLQAGQFHTNFSLEGPMAPLDMEAISYAPIVDVIACKNPDTRDIGIAAYGSFAKRDGYSIVEYCLGAFNGEGKNKLDLNKSKNIVTRVKINPVKQLTLSGSFSYGEQEQSYVKNLRYAAGLWWRGERFFLRSEYLTMNQNKGGAKYDVSGCYAVAGLWIKKFCPILRYGYMNNELSGAAVRQSDYLVGIDYKPLKYLRLQANYNRTHYNGQSNGANLLGVVVTGIF